VDGLFGLGEEEMGRGRCEAREKISNTILARLDVRSWGGGRGRCSLGGGGARAS